MTFKYYSIVPHDNDELINKVNALGKENVDLVISAISKINNDIRDFNTNKLKEAVDAEI